MTGSRESRRQSTFVTVVAWVFIVINGFMSFMAVGQNIILLTMFDADRMPSVPDDAPLFVALMNEYFYLFFLAFLGISVLMLIASIGLLKRRNWARITFITILGLGVVWTLGASVAGFFMSFGPSIPADAPDQTREAYENMKSTLLVMRVFTLVFSIAIAGLFGWIIRRLTSSDIRAEFAT